ncbi:MAG: hypothetical protein LBM75_08575 [Myxococcales bacterium]|jgi:tetratricopeptide (TPR) repeat protein|nr:hypothetical protein [Myxococcales bacterium]
MNFQEVAELIKKSKLRRRAGKLVEAERDLNVALELLEKTSNEETDDCKIYKAKGLIAQGDLKRRLGEFEEAERDLNVALELLKKTPNEEADDCKIYKAKGLIARGDLKRRLGEFKEAEKDLKGALKLLEKISNEETNDCKIYEADALRLKGDLKLISLGRLTERQNEVKTALNYYEEARDLCQKDNPNNELQKLKTNSEKEIKEIEKADEIYKRDTNDALIKAQKGYADDAGRYSKGCAILSIACMIFAIIFLFLFLFCPDVFNICMCVSEPKQSCQPSETFILKFSLGILFFIPAFYSSKLSKRCHDQEKQYRELEIKMRCVGPSFKEIQSSDKEGA